jgi:predicted metallopeptidase
VEKEMPRGRPKGSGNNVQTMPTSYYKCEESIEKMANEMLAKYHPEIVNCKIAYLWCSKDMKSGGKIALAQVQKVGPRVKALLEYDFIITISSPIWKTLSTEQQYSVLDHELYHIFVDEDSAGEPKYQLLKHDIEEFTNVVLNHGIVFDSIRQKEPQLQRKNRNQKMT